VAVVDGQWSRECVATSVMMKRSIPSRCWSMLFTVVTLYCATYFRPLGLDSFEQEFCYERSGLVYVDYSSNRSNTRWDGSDSRTSSSSYKLQFSLLDETILGVPFPWSPRSCPRPIHSAHLRWRKTPTTTHHRTFERWWCWLQVLLVLDWP